MDAPTTGVGPHFAVFAGMLLWRRLQDIAHHFLTLAQAHAAAGDRPWAIDQVGRHP